MSIYLGSTSLPLPSLDNLSMSPAHECIGVVYRLLSEVLGRGAKPETSLMDRISADIDSPELIELVERISDESSYHLSPSTNGVILALDNATQQPFAVIKPSRKRANYETFAYLLAKKLSLHDHILPSAFCAIKNPRAHSAASIENGDWMEELFNGDFKQLNIPALSDCETTSEVFLNESDDSNPDLSESEDDLFLPVRRCDSDDDFIVFESASDGGEGVSSGEEPDSETSSADKRSCSRTGSYAHRDYFAVGVIEPFINKTIESISDENIGEYAKMVLLCLALGLRDGKDDGYINFKLIDVEEIMPNYLLPTEEDQEKNIAATHLPLLDNVFSARELSAEIIHELRTIVNSWNMEDLEDFLSHYPVKYQDAVAEIEKRLKTTDELVDEGGCEYKYIPESAMFAEQAGLYQFKGLPKKDLLESQNLLDADQIETFFKRMILVKLFILENDEFTLRDLVFHVDPQYKAAMDKISQLVGAGVAAGNSNAGFYQRASPFDTAGRVSPFHVRKKTASPEKT